MPRPPHQPLDPDDENREIRSELQEVKAENRELKNKCEKLYQAYVALTKARSGHQQPESLLMSFLVLALLRMILFIFVERMGKAAASEAMPANDVFAGIGAILLILWMAKEWKANHPGVVIAKLAVLAVGLVVAVSIFTDDMVWVGVMNAPNGRPFVGMGIVIGTVILVASPLVPWLMDNLQGIVTDPVMKIREWRGDFK
jgi:hypothetical protein